jgi:lysophospholipase L1-like esterase
MTTSATGKWIAMAAIAFVPLSIAGARQSAAPKTLEKLNDADGNIVVVGFGDSITGCYYHTGGRRAWPEMLKLALDKAFPHARIDMHNAGKSGHTTPQGLARIRTDVLEKNPDLVVVMFGMNDLAYGQVDAETDRAKKTTFAKNLADITQQCRKTGAEVILCTQNTVYPEAAPGRPPKRIAEFAAVIRDLGERIGTPVVDVCAEWQRLRREEPTEWRLAMSETIHPSLDGHRRMAELIAAAITTQDVSLADEPPAPPALAHVSACLRTAKGLNIVVSQPLHSILFAALKTLRPDAGLALAADPIDGRTLKQLELQARTVRDCKPDLVVFTIPVDCLDATDEEAFIRTLSWTLDLCLPFAGRPWDVVGVSPQLLLPGVPSEKQQRAIHLFKRIVAAHDLHTIARTADDVDAAPEEIVRRWFATHLGD